MYIVIFFAELILLFKFILYINFNTQSPRHKHLILFVLTYRGEDQCSNFLTDTIQFFQGDFTDFFEKDIPNFFESTIPKTAIHVGDEIVDVAETGIGELVKFANGMYWYNTCSS